MIGRRTVTRSCIAAVCAFFAHGLVACDSESKLEKSDRRAPIRIVTLVATARVPAPRTIEVSGKLEARDEVRLAMSVGGRLAKLDIDIGDVAERGRTIAALDTVDFDLELERARAALTTACTRLGITPETEDVDLETAAPVSEAKAVLQEARLARERVAAMVGERVRSAAELEDAEATLAVASSRLQAARDEVRTFLAEIAQRRIDVRTAQRRLDEASLEAPWNGRVTARHASVGQILAPGAPVVTLIRAAPLRLSLQVPELEADRVRAGQAVLFTVDGTDSTLHRGNVERLGPSIDRAARTLHVEAAVPDPEDRLRPGSFCRARIVIDERATTLVVPRDAVTTFAGIARVFVVETTEAGLTAKGIVVTPGREIGERLEVLDGLEEGTRVVASAKGLQNGNRLEIGE
ncbi:MAG: efflux RND transporter periplasmic adaptor subunit [Planctomycetes bacterium]|nr:efflux RND transporter periplasmic adaptor subunit [Planctomycetota bacterium]MCB9918987.1 efflux RND transporter periplasmic adaptor subunit [Planctomycetota bacterium]